MPEAGKYLLICVGFSKEKQPFISLQKDAQIISFSPLNKALTLDFDLDERYCTGWRDLASGEQHPCPDQHIVDKKYEQCPACQNRTGFNPAFYHATSVSKQQEQRNLEPHFLYLAHFGKNVTKVGISYAGRGHSRLLEQGARTAIILETFPTAHIARQYEAQIAALPGIAETIQPRKKIELLGEAYDPTIGARELLNMQTSLEKTLGKEFAKNGPVHLDQHYFPTRTPKLSDGFDCTPLGKTSGIMIGALGSLFFFDQQETPLFLPMKKYVGYQLSLSYTLTPVELPARQISLF